ncbi:MAG: arylesterase [Alphaproteobacteria bacterium]|nr:arylesterase [Alphaproteobacteria bacterium]
MSSLLFAASVYAAPLKLMVYGDSLSAGYQLPQDDSFYTQLEKSLQSEGENVRVLDYSKSGETSEGGVAKVTAALDMEPDAVLLELGINDILHGVSVTATQKNLQKIIDAFKEKEIPVLLVGMEAPVLMDLSYRKSFKNMYQFLAQKNDLMLYPFFMNGLWNDNGKHKDYAYFLSDLVHPSAQGVAIITKNILPTVKKFLKIHFPDRK